MRAYGASDELCSASDELCVWSMRMHMRAFDLSRSWHARGCHAVRVGRRCRRGCDGEGLQMI